MNGSRHFHRIASLARRMGLGHNSLRRPTDRIESAGLVVAVLLALALLPAAIVVGSLCYHHSLVIVATQNAARHQVTATLTQNAPTDTDSDGMLTLADAPAQWQWPAGVTHTGQAQTTVGAKAGSTVSIWVDNAGSTIAAPLTSDQAFGRGVLYGVLAWLAGISLLTGLFALLRWLLVRRELAAWTAEWDRIGPQWTDHQPR